VFLKYLFTRSISSFFTLFLNIDFGWILKIQTYVTNCNLKVLAYTGIIERIRLCRRPNCSESLQHKPQSRIRQRKNLDFQSEIHLFGQNFLVCFKINVETTIQKNKGNNLCSTVLEKKILRCKVELKIYYIYANN
jgi:hypothetical protein